MAIRFIGQDDHAPELATRRLPPVIPVPVLRKSGRVASRITLARRLTVTSLAGMGRVAH
jgi:hypothetical protein